MYIIIRKDAAAASESALALVPCHVTAKMARLKFGKVVIALGHKRMRGRGYGGGEGGEGEGKERAFRIIINI